MDKEPFNDVIDHFDKVEGNAGKGNLKKLPRPLRFFGYFVLSFFGIGLLLMVILNVLK